MQFAEQVSYQMLGLAQQPDAIIPEDTVEKHWLRLLYSQRKLCKNEKNCKQIIFNVKYENDLRA